MMIQFMMQFTNIIHLCSGPAAIEHAASAHGSTYPHIGVIQASLHDEFVKDLKVKLAGAQQRKGDKRSAAGNEQGHQKTAGFITTLARDALSNIGKSDAQANNSQPLGGFTDVGLHTGGKHRDTAYPLVREALRAALQFEYKCTQPQLLFRLVLAHWELMLAEEYIGSMPTSLTYNHANDAMQMILSAATKAGELHEDGHDPDPGGLFEERLIAARSHLDERATADARAKAKGFDLPEFDDTWYSGHSFVDPTIVLSGTDHPPAPSADLLTSARTAAELNIGWLPVVFGESSINAALRMLRHPRTAASNASRQLALHVVEHLLFSRAASDRLDGLCWDEIEQLQEMTTCYRSASHVFRQSNPGGIMLTDLRSREILVLWIEFCMVHAATRKKHTILNGYGVALDANELRHLVLSDRHAVDAMLRVVVYLRRNGRQSAVFRLGADDDATFEMAEQYARDDAKIKAIWNEEQHNAKEREDNHFEEAQRKQLLSRELRQQIVSAELTLRRLDDDMKRLTEDIRLQRQKLHLNDTERLKIDACRESNHRADYRYGGGGGYGEGSGVGHRYGSVFGGGRGGGYDRSGGGGGGGDGYDSDGKNSAERLRLEREKRKLDAQIATAQSKSNDLQHEIRDCRRQLDGLRRKLSDAEKSPPPVLQPLPRRESSALRVLFFLHMPKHFRRLAQISCTAQQAMLPDTESHQSAVGSRATVSVQKAAIEWCAYYNSKGGAPKGRSGDMLLFTTRNPPHPSEVELQHVDLVRLRSDGVWYPDEIGIQILWQGGSFEKDRKENQFFNPFVQLPTLLTSDFFTERLPLEHSALQWMLLQPGLSQVSRERVNRSIVSQHDKPSWLTKSEYLAFGSLRAYPHIQLRAFCIILHERGLPFEHGAVATLILQAAYHAGDISPPAVADPFPVWRTDAIRGGLLSVLLHELDGLAAELEQTPRRHVAVRLLGELAAYFSAWESSTKHVAARRFARASRAWADDLQAQIDSSLPCEVAILRRRQAAVMYLTSLSCYGGARALSEDDIPNLVQVLVLARHSSTIMEDGSSDDELNALWGRCMRVTAARLEDVHRHFCQSPAVFTAAIRLVIQQTPDSLEWEQSRFGAPAGGTLCYEAVSQSHLFSLNALTGVVLFDGSPPSRLPIQVLEAPSYMRLFGTRSFEIVRSEANVMETVRPVSGRFYQFCFIDNRLRIYELLETRNIRTKLELLDDTDLSNWTLPVRLREMHSHWLNWDKKVVLLRPLDFRNRDVAFFLWFGENTLPHIHHNLPGQPRSATCFQVPLHRRKEEWQRLFDGRAEFDRLKLHESKMTEILHKCEDSRFLHTFVTPSLNIKFELPRMKLCFELRDDGNLHSLTYSGYKLAKCQQLDDTLRGLSCYLCLEKVNDSIEMISEMITRVVIPVGTIKRPLSKGTATITTQTAYDAQIECHVYDEHPLLRTLKAPDIPARLYLAVLYAATSSRLPEPRLVMTGQEHAMELLRQSWVNRPLQKAEYESLRNLLLFTEHASGLGLLCLELAKSSSRLNHLHPTSGGTPELDVQSSADLISAYMCDRQKLCVRLWLTPEEELRTMGVRCGPSAADEWASTRSGRALAISGAPLDAYASTPQDFVKQTEGRLKEMCTSIPGPGDAPPFPLEPGKIESDSHLKKEMLGQLTESWKTYHQMALIDKEIPHDDFAEKESCLKSTQKEVQVHKHAIYRYLAGALAMPNKGKVK